MSPFLTPVIAATARWLVTAYPAAGGALGEALALGQARQAVTVASWLRYPTVPDAELVHLVGPGGSDRLDWLLGADPAAVEAWRTWVDEVVASWAACLLGEGDLAAAAVEALRDTGPRPRGAGIRYEFGRLLRPSDRERDAAALLRHPDLLAPVADLHREPLLARLRA